MSAVDDAEMGDGGKQAAAPARTPHTDAGATPGGGSLAKHIGRFVAAPAAGHVHAALGVVGLRVTLSLSVAKGGAAVLGLGASTPGATLAPQKLPVSGAASGTSATASGEPQPKEVLRTDSVSTEHDSAAGGSSRKRKSSVIAGDLNAHLVAKAVRAQLRKTADPAAVSRKELREALEKQLGCDLAEWKGAIKDAAVAFIAA